MIVHCITQMRNLTRHFWLFDPIFDKLGSTRIIKYYTNKISDTSFLVVRPIFWINLTEEIT